MALAKKCYLKYFFNRQCNNIKNSLPLHECVTLCVRLIFSKTFVQLTDILLPFYILSVFPVLPKEFINVQQHMLPKSS